jgi:hypothetical protein
VKRRRLLPLCLLAALVGVPSWVSAETTVPLDLQIELLRKVVRFERGFSQRVGAEVRVMVVVRSANSDSVRAAAQVEKALEHAHEIVGKPIKIIGHSYSSADALKKAIGQASATVVYLTPGFEGELGAIAQALVGVPAITVSTDGDQVDQGAVLGFELVAARPRIALNFAQAKRQGLDFNSDLFRLARVVK